MTLSQLYQFVNKLAVDPTTGCWLWLGGKDKDGYGNFLVNKRVHKVAFEHWRGKLRTGKVVDHLCRVRHCANPRHMRSTTPLQNTFAAGSLAVAALNRQKTTCKVGHPLAGINLYVRQNGARTCVQCNRVRSREYQRRKSAAKIVAAIEEGTK